MLSTCSTKPINKMRRLPHGSSSTISINTVKSTSRIRESCFCYLTDIHLIRSSQFLPDTAIMQLITRTRRILSKWEYLLPSLLNLPFHLSGFLLSMATSSIRLATNAIPPFLIVQQIFLTRYSDEEHYGRPSQMAHIRQNDTTISLSSTIAAINITTETTVLIISEFSTLSLTRNISEDICAAR
ncbi:hypothetical protein T11_10004 [Trichinella zimbabwensis]|uniref:Uncharacterized protein n=1 Tax=Trichinella zimbabwensis TaxID=268475 RepID=A0A0V1H1D8_9BILA|nr:hypothetical protein T11_10004 [Trichinella zimbabwensis]